MKLSDAYTYYEFFSGKASELARQLAFAGIAVIWVFRRAPPNEETTIPAALFAPGFYFCLALAFDLLHYVAGTIAWGRFHRYHEVRLAKPGADPTIDAPRYINWAQSTFFSLKLAAVAAGYFFLLQFLARVSSS